MHPCTLEYIPARLKRDNRPVIPIFQVGENLFYRCKAEHLENPYKTISIAELSHNRSGDLNEPLSQADDVLFNIRQDDPIERYLDLEVCTLEIKSLTPQNIYKKHFSEIKANISYSATMELIHGPENCMYPHSVFRVYLAEEVVTIENYKTTLAKYQKLKTSIKEELASMIKRKQVHQNEAPI